MTIKERVNKLFEDFSISLQAEETNLEAQAVLENGTTIFTDADSFVEGADVYILNDEGERIPLPQGDYTFQDGGVLSVLEGGKVGSFAKGGGKEGHPKKGVPSADADGGGGGSSSTPSGGDKKKKKSAQDRLEEDEEEEVVVVDEKEEEEMMDESMIIDIINRVLDERFPPTEEEKEEKEELSAMEVMEQTMNALETELFELKKQSASKGFKRAMRTAPKMEAVDLKGKSTEERVKILANKYHA